VICSILLVREKTFHIFLRLLPGEAISLWLTDEGVYFSVVIEELIDGDQ